MIILLDLNYTLVANNPARGTTPERMEKRLAGEQYRQWLVEMVRPLTVVLITARPANWMTKTLDRITLQFTPIEYRQQIIRRVFESLAPGGAFILVEKVLGATSKLDEAFVNLFLNIKRENGYSESQIDRKRMSLEGVLVPVTARWNEELLYREGFTSIDCFWRHLNFAGWVAVKP